MGNAGQEGLWKPEIAFMNHVVFRTNKRDAWVSYVELCRNWLSYFVCILIDHAAPTCISRPSSPTLLKESGKELSLRHHGESEGRGDEGC